jgi:hypothetical protein
VILLTDHAIFYSHLTNDVVLKAPAIVYFDKLNMTTAGAEDLFALRQSYFFVSAY